MTDPQAVIASSNATATLASTTTGSDGAGLMAFLIVAALFVACWCLYRSLRRQLGRIDVTRAAAERADTDPNREISQS